MSGHPLEDARFQDQWYGQRRHVSFDDGVLTVELRSDDTYDSVEHHYRLVEVRREWMEVKES